MAVREVLKYPNDLLKQEAVEVTKLNDEIKDIITDLKDTMLDAGHSTGIAAPQIGKLVRIITIDASLNKKCKENHGFMVMINPEIIEHSGTTTSREGCMSVPDYTGNVTRAESIVVSYFDENMQQNVLETSGFEAILIQHETDHLNGMLFIDRVISKRTDLFKRKKY